MRATLIGPTTEAEVWREIAARIERGAWHREGLCAEIDAATGYWEWDWRPGTPEALLRRRMVDRLYEHRLDLARAEGAPEYLRHGTVPAYSWPEGEAEPRILAAYALAEEAERP
jgi:hypothetical protein